MEPAAQHHVFVYINTGTFHVHVFLVFEWMLYVLGTCCVYTYVIYVIYGKTYARMLRERTNAPTAHVQGSQNHSRHTCRTEREVESVGSPWGKCKKQ